MSASSPGKHKRRYRLVAHYDNPPVVRSTVIEAEDEKRAMTRALLEHYVPARFEADEHGWLAPVAWSPELAGPRRWPHFKRHNVLVWGDEGPRSTIRFEIEKVEQ